MRKKFWDYIENPSAKKKAELTSEEVRFAERLKDKDKPAGTAKPEAPAPKKK